MHKFLVMLAVCAVLGLGDEARAERLKIVATTADLADLAGRLAGEHGAVRFICDGREDPHFLNARPSFILLARDADLWIRVGLELEIGWEPPVLDGSRNTRIQIGQPGHLDASAGVLQLEAPGGPISREMGDVHPSGNPHYWLDPWNVRVMAATIAARLIELRPVHAAAFQVNLERFTRELDERMFGPAAVAALGGDRLWQAVAADGLDDALNGKGVALGGWLAALRPLRGQSLVTYHKSWPYFARRFGLTVAAELEPKPGVPPTAAHLTALAERMRSEGIGLILQEPFYSRKAADRLARQTGARVIVAAASVGGTPAATDVLRVFDALVAALSGATP